MDSKVESNEKSSGESDGQGTAHPERPNLNQGTIVAAAVDLADTAGVDALTMRRLAQHLGYKVMSLYNHVAGKDEVLALMADSVAAEIELPGDQVEPLAAIRAVALGTRAALVRHPWAADIWLRHLPGPNRTAHMEFLLRAFACSGLSTEVAHHGFHAVTNHVVGYTLQELAMGQSMGHDPTDMARAEEFVSGLSPQDHPHSIAHVGQHLRGETSSSFALVLDLILDGLVRLDAG